MKRTRATGTTGNLDLAGLTVSAREKARNTIKSPTAHEGMTISEIDDRVKDNCPTKNSSVDKIPRPPRRTNAARSKRRKLSGRTREIQAPAPNAAIATDVRPANAPRKSRSMGQCDHRPENKPSNKCEPATLRRKKVKIVSEIQDSATIAKTVERGFSVPI
jgi:hypothetical protein